MPDNRSLLTYLDVIDDLARDDLVAVLRGPVLDRVAPLFIRQKRPISLSRSLLPDNRSLLPYG